MRFVSWEDGHWTREVTCTSNSQAWDLVDAITRAAENGDELPQWVRELILEQENQEALDAIIDERCVHNPTVSK